VCVGVIRYLKFKQKTLREMSRVLKPDGTVLLTILSRASLGKCFYIAILAKRSFQKMAGKASKRFKMI